MPPATLKGSAARNDLTQSPSVLVGSSSFPMLRYMGGKHRLIDWIHESTHALPFRSVLDAFSGSSAVSYLFKRMGKRVTSNDFLHFSHQISKATIQNSFDVLSDADISTVLKRNGKVPDFIRKTFKDIFFTPQDRAFLDLASWNIPQLPSEHKRAVAYAALFRSCLKKQPRGVFTVAGSAERYDDGRRDLRLSLAEHFEEQVQVFNELVFDNGHQNVSMNMDIFDLSLAKSKFDLVYLDPPYVPRADDNCYVKRYHFLEGLSRYWKDCEIVQSSKVKKIRKRYTPFSYRSEAVEAFDRLFSRFSRSILVLSYSSNGYPDLQTLTDLMRRRKQEVIVKKRKHRYHFGTHANVKRSLVDEYLIIGV